MKCCGRPWPMASTILQQPSAVSLFTIFYVHIFLFARVFIGVCEVECRYVLYTYAHDNNNRKARNLRPTCWIELAALHMVRPEMPRLDAKIYSYLAVELVLVSVHNVSE